MEISTGGRQKLGEIEKIELAHLPQQHVLRVADNGGRRADVAGRGQPDEERDRVQFGFENGGAEDRGEGQANDVVGQKSRQQSAEGHNRQQKNRDRDMSPVSCSATRV